MSTLPNHPWMVGRAITNYRDAIAAGATPAEAAVHLADNIAYIEGLLIDEAKARVWAVEAYQGERRAVAEAEQLKAKLSAQAKPPHVCVCPVTAGPPIIHTKIDRCDWGVGIHLEPEVREALHTGDDDAWAMMRNAITDALNAKPLT